MVIIANLSIPRNKDSELVLYVWKIIDIPMISKKEIIYKISFELLLMTPEEAKIFIIKSINNQYLIEEGENDISLTLSLKKKLKTWNERRKDEILSNSEATRKKVAIKDRLEENNNINYGVLLKAFCDQATLNRAVSVTANSFDITTFNFKEGIIKAKVAGSQKEGYNIEINIHDKLVRHDCGDFITKRAKNKKFCKHLVKLFLLLKERNQDLASNFLKEIAINIDKWNFLD